MCHTAVINAGIGSGDGLGAESERQATEGFGDSDVEHGCPNTAWVSLSLSIQSTVLAPLSISYTILRFFKVTGTLSLP